ncbi:hypothetical protein [Aquimarina latercula]|uniref:hypothetical protein n=1 Tax=Aquimarina latercula TaxID=987 RepID=UPI0004274B23|nr:hypothetical protein [Aquimarina latercula]
MKNLKNYLFVILALFLCSNIVKAQENINVDTETITGVFDGFDGENFTFNYTTEDGDDDTMLFPKANPEVLKEYNLSNDKLVGKTFKVTFISETETEEDEDGDEQEYTVRTIVNLELLD